MSTSAKAGAVTRWVSTRLRRKAERARHNDFDYACRHWWGDRDPDAGDRTNREFGGDPTLVDLRRCLVCRPYGRGEADALVEFDLTDMDAPSPRMAP